MTDTRPIQRCQEKACPVIGRFDSGYCPMHADDVHQPFVALWDTNEETEQ